jgi:hypothetical protein
MKQAVSGDGTSNALALFDSVRLFSLQKLKISLHCCRFELHQDIQGNLTTSGKLFPAMFPVMTQTSELV